MEPQDQTERESPAQASEQMRATPAVDDSVASCFVELGNYERHFNEMQSRYRAPASTWLLATFVGVGFILSQETLDVPVSRELAVAMLALFGAFGIGLLWNLDLMVYHRLQDAVFAAGLRLEINNRQLPPVRRNMMRTGIHGVLPRVISFYLGASGVLLLISLTGFVVWMVGVLPVGARIAAVFAAVAAWSCLLVWMYRRTGMLSPLTAELMSEGTRAVREGGRLDTLSRE